MSLATSMCLFATNEIALVCRAVNGPRILRDCGPGLLAKKDLNWSLGPVLQRANIIA